MTLQQEEAQDLGNFKVNAENLWIQREWKDNLEFAEMSARVQKEDHSF